MVDSNIFLHFKSTHFSPLSSLQTRLHIDHTSIQGGSEYSWKKYHYRYIKVESHIRNTGNQIL